MDIATRAEKYLFIVALTIAVLAYWAGGVKLIQAGGPQLNTLLVSAQGRTSTGQFAAYPTGAPAA